MKELFFLSPMSFCSHAPYRLSIDFVLCAITLLDMLAALLFAFGKKRALSANVNEHAVRRKAEDIPDLEGTDRRVNPGRSDLLLLLPPLSGIFMSIAGCISGNMDPAVVAGLCAISVITCGFCWIDVMKKAVLVISMTVTAVSSIFFCPAVMNILPFIYLAAVVFMEQKSYLPDPVSFAREIEPSKYVSVSVDIMLVIIILLTCSVHSLCSASGSIVRQIAGSVSGIVSITAYSLMQFSAISGRQLYLPYGNMKYFETNFPSPRKTIVIRNSSSADQSDDLFERLEEWFGTCRPYLNPYLVVADVCKELFTNKVYLSRAIKEHTGCNFCTYVNHARVYYAIDLFKANPSLRVGELASASGFRSDSTFNLAFRDIMGESPSDWIRKYRSGIQK